MSTTLALICSDLSRAHDQPCPQSDATVAQTLFVLRLAPAAKSIALIGYRLSAALARRHATSAVLLKQLTQMLSGADISPHATIGEGLCIFHPVGIVVGPDVVIGARCTIQNGVTLGDNGHGSPTIGDDVWIGPGACLAGPFTVGDGCTIGANTVMTKTIGEPEPKRYATIVGAPARLLRQDPAEAERESAMRPPSS